MGVPVIRGSTGTGVLHYRQEVSFFGVWLLFIGAFPDGRTDADGFGIGDWQEKWMLINPDDPSSTAVIRNGSRVAILSVPHGEHICGPMDGSVQTTAGAVGAGEIWTIENI